MRRLYRNTVLFSSVGIGSVITLYLRNKSLNGISNDQEALCRPRSAIIIGGGIIGISSALQLAKRGVNVTVIEEQPDVSRVASYCNGAIICNSMAASWASANLLAQNPGELKNIRVGLSSWTDHRFYRWAAWFWANSLMPGWAEANHESCRQLAALSIEARAAEEAEYGDKVDMNKTALETIKMFHNTQEMEDFLSSAQASFWRSRGHEFLALSPEQCRQLEPALAEAEARHGDPDNTGLEGGVLCGRGLDTSGDVHVYTCNIARLARDMGVSIRCSERVSRILVSPDSGHVTGIQLDTGEMVTGDVYVIAAGARSGDLGRQVGVTLPVYPLKGHLVTVRPAPGHKMVTRNIYSPRHGLLSPLHPDGLRLSGGVQAVGEDTTVDMEMVRSLVQRFEGAVVEGAIESSRPDVHACLRPVSGDDVPIIGQTRIKNLYANTGHGSKGWTYSWGSATLLAKIVCGEEIENIDPKMFNPRRFHPIRNLAGIS